MILAGIILVAVVILVFIGFVTFIIFKKCVIVVSQTEVCIIERFGKYKDTWKPGIYFLVPIIDEIRRIDWRYQEVDSHGNITTTVFTTDKVDLREHVIDFGRQRVITKDTVSIEIDALVYYQISDPLTAILKVQDLPDSIELLTQTTLRNIIAQITLDDTFSSRDLVNAMLKERTLADAERWGVTINRVEIQSIIPPDDIKNVMESQITNERARRANVIEADGKREQCIIDSKGTAAQLVLEAEGKKTAKIQIAKGEAEAKILLAQAESEAVKTVQAALEECGSDFSSLDYILAKEYIGALGNIDASNLDVVLLPIKGVDFVKQIFKDMNSIIKKKTD